MANLNKVMLIGRLTRDPEAIAGGKGAKFGFAVNNRKLNPDSQRWEDVPVFIDMEIWNRGDTSRQADRFLESVKKGHQVYIEGHLRLDTWDDRNGGGKRNKLVVVVESFQYLERRLDGTEEDGGMASAPAPRVQASRGSASARRPEPAPARGGSRASEDDEGASPSGGYGRSAPSDGNEDDIPF